MSNNTNSNAGGAGGAAPMSDADKANVEVSKGYTQYYNNGYRILVTRLALVDPTKAWPTAEAIHKVLSVCKKGLKTWCEMDPDPGRTDRLVKIASERALPKRVWDFEILSLLPQLRLAKREEDLFFLHVTGEYEDNTFQLKFGLYPLPFGSSSPMQIVSVSRPPSQAGASGAGASGAVSRRRVSVAQDVSLNMVHLVNVSLPPSAPQARSARGSSAPMRPPVVLSDTSAVSVHSAPPPVAVPDGAGGASLPVATAVPDGAGGASLPVAVPDGAGGAGRSLDDVMLPPEVIHSMDRLIAKVRQLEGEADTLLKRIAQLDQGGADRDRKIAELERTLSARDAEKTELLDKLKANDSRISELDRALYARNVENGQLQNQVGTGTARITELEGQFAASDARASMMEPQLSGKDARIAELEASLAKARKMIDIKTERAKVVGSNVRDLKRKLAALEGPTDEVELVQPAENNGGAAAAP